MIGPSDRTEREVLRFTFKSHLTKWQHPVAPSIQTAWHRTGLENRSDEKHLHIIGPKARQSITASRKLESNSWSQLHTQQIVTQLLQRRKGQV